MDPVPTDGPISLDEISERRLFGLWILPIMPWIIAQCRHAFRPEAGKYDWTDYRTDENGRVVGRDGKPIGYVTTERVDPTTGTKSVCYELAAGLVPTTDGYDHEDWLAHDRERVGDWADACRALTQLVTPDAKRPAEIAARRKRKRTLPTPRESQAMELKSRGHTLTQIGTEMGITKERARQLLMSGHSRQGPHGRSIDLSKAAELPSDYSLDKLPAKRIPRQRGRTGRSSDDT